MLREAGGGLLFGLILLYQFTPLKIEWIGLLVIGIYLAVYLLVFSRHRGWRRAAASRHG